jgi:hypothetical protein
MKRVVTVSFVLLVFGLFSSGSAHQAEEADPATDVVKYAVNVHEFEGCECNPVCPCVFSSDTTFGNCRGITVFMFTGKYGATMLKDVSCAVVFLWSGKNMEATMGKWRGVLYTPDTATPAQIEAINGLLRVMLDDAFATLEKRTAPIKIRRDKDVHDLTIGTVAHLRIHALKGQNGKITKVLNAPSPLGYPVMTCAVADVHTYNDGKASWDFAGRNGFYADFDLSNQKH